MLRFAIAMCLLPIGAACANERSLELINSFQFFCTQQPVEFNALDAKAKAMGIAVHKDEPMPTTGGPHVRSRSWIVPLKSGPYELIVGETRGVDSGAASCSMAASDVDGDEMKQDLVKALKLGKPVLEIASSEGMPRVTNWNYGADAALWLADKAEKWPGINLQLVRKTY